MDLGLDLKLKCKLKLWISGFLSFPSIFLWKVPLDFPLGFLRTFLWKTPLSFLWTFLWGFLWTFLWVSFVFPLENPFVCFFQLCFCLLSFFVVGGCEYSKW
jgi:hypothetical protein